MDITYQIAQTENAEQVFEYEFSKNFPSSQYTADELMENKINAWDSFYRKESLEHYFKTGWSFIAVDSNNEIKGFFIAQPLLFLDKQTQTLWVEYVSAVNQEIYTELIDIAYKLAREKHFQRVIFSSEVKDEPLQKQFDFKEWNRNHIFLKTTK